ncbi:MAG: hypothetical protein J6M39_09795 [Lachnospiraceae bacterium]|nr:hypothetical protein [Lachnospiraceae bacterium]
MIKKVLTTLFVILLCMTTNAFAKVYDISQISQVKVVTDYSSNTTVDQMDTVTFGSYPQSDVSGSTKEPIEWIVIEKQNGKALLFSRYILDCKYYNDSFEKSTWETCSLRNWLNTTFLNTAFNNDEQNIILFSELINDEDNGKSAITNNTNDKVFLLGFYEIFKMPHNNGRRVWLENAKTTNFVKQINNSLNFWWLRDKISGASEYAWCLDKDGASADVLVVKIFNYAGSGKDIEPKSFGVRPAIWVNTTTLGVGGNNGGVGNNSGSSGGNNVGIGQNGNARGTIVPVLPGNSSVDEEMDLEYSLKEKQPDPDSWYKTKGGAWYYYESDRTTKKKGWFVDPTDGQTYYLKPSTGRMAVGWTKIDGSSYYFNEYHDNPDNWISTGGGWYIGMGEKVKAYGSMFRDEITPDGKYVDIFGKLVQ